MQKKINFSIVKNCNHSVTERHISAYFQNLLQMNKIFYKFAQIDHFHKNVANNYLRRFIGKIYSIRRNKA